MTATTRTVIACSCEDTMPLDGKALAQGCKGVDLKTARHLCRSQIDLFKSVLGASADVTVGCTQEAPLFEEVAADLDYAGQLTYANIREAAGWSVEAAKAGPKMAALLAAAAEPMPPTPFTSLTSKGVALIYGRDECAINAANKLADQLDVTVILTKAPDTTPPRLARFPILQGTVTRAGGHLGAFELVLDDVASADPSSRQRLVFGPARNGAVSHCDILIDLTGGSPLFPAHDLREGYLRADSHDKTAVYKAIHEASQLVGTFDKPAYAKLDPDLCAHSRSKRTGCTRCLDLCPTGAITPQGDHVAISAEICAGCGACAAICPTGAITYTLPPADALMRRLRTLLVTFEEAGGRGGVVLLHDEDHGGALIEALARFGDGLPAHVLPLRVNEVEQIGLELMAAALAYGAAAVAVLSRARPRHDQAGLRRLAGYANAISRELGFGPECVRLIEADDPDQLAAALGRIGARPRLARPARFRPMGAGRSLLKQTMQALHEAAPTPVPVIALDAGAPFGAVKVRAEGCTLCLACVSACPVAALGDNAEQPMLTFQEDLCVQCGLCQATCPEKVITLEPRLDFSAWGAGKAVLKQEEPFHCINCAKPFGVKSTVERIVAKLENKHWMFSGDQAKRISVIRMCEDCRVEVVVNESFDPHQSPPRPNVRTTEDYLRERKERGEDPLN